MSRRSTRRLFAFSTLILAIASNAIGAPPASAQRAESDGRAKPRVKEYLDRRESGRRGAIAALEHKLRGLQREVRPSAQTQSQTRRLERELADLKGGRVQPVPAIDFAPLLGQIGRLPEGGAHVEQILDDESMLVRATFPVTVVTSRGGAPRGERTHQQQWFLVRGLATDEFSEGADVPLTQTLYVSSRWHYTTATGGRHSVLVLEPYDVEKDDARR